MQGKIFSLPSSGAHYTWGDQMLPIGLSLGAPAFLLSHGKVSGASHPHCSRPTGDSQHGTPREFWSFLCFIFPASSWWVCPPGLLRRCSEEGKCRPRVTNPLHLSRFLHFQIPSTSFQGSARTSASLNRGHHGVQGLVRQPSKRLTLLPVARATVVWSIAKQNSHISLPSLCIPPHPSPLCSVTLLQFPSQGGIHFSTPSNPDWPCDVLCSTENGRRDFVGVLRPGPPAQRLAASTPLLLLLWTARGEEPERTSRGTAPTDGQYQRPAVLGHSSRPGQPSR